MNRTEYLNQTKKAFTSKAIESPFFKNHFDPIEGVYRVVEIIGDSDFNHPLYSEIPFTITCQCQWKATLDDDFLEEYVNWFDFGFLIKHWKKVESLPDGSQKDPNYNVHILYRMSQFRDIHIIDPKSGDWEFIDKINSVIVCNELSRNSSILVGDKLLPFPEIPQLKPKIYSFSTKYDHVSHNLYQSDTEIITVTEENFEDILKYGIGPSLYFIYLDNFRNEYGTQMADTVPVKGYYKIHTIRIDPAREITKKVNGIEIKETAPWDLPYQIIGIGHWLTPDIPADSLFRFNEEISVEIRLNPLFNKIAIAEGIDPSYPKEKRWDTFYQLAKQRIFHIKEVRLEENAYFIHWGLIRHSEPVKETGFS